MFLMKWTCDAEGNWRRIWVSVDEKDGRLVETHSAETRRKAA